MKYLLDTNICIYLMKHEVPAAKARFEQCLYGDAEISAITLAELRYGIELRPDARSQNERALDGLLVDLVVAMRKRRPLTVLQGKSRQQIVDINLKSKRQ